MKIRILILSIITSMLVCLASVTALAADDIKIYINGGLLKVDQPPIIYQERVLAPIRAVSERLGCKVSWDEATQTALIEDPLTKVAVKIDTYYLTVINRATNVSETVPIDVPAMIVNERTLLPVRAVAEVLRADVKWDGATQTVFVERGYDTIREYIDGNCLVEDWVDDKFRYGFVDSTGRLAVPCLYDRGSKPYKSVYYYLERDGVKGVMDGYGNELIPFGLYDTISFASNDPSDHFDYCRDAYDNDLVIVKKSDDWKNNDYGLIKIDGTVVLPCLYENISFWEGALQITYADDFKVRRYTGTYDSSTGKLDLQSVLE